MRIAVIGAALAVVGLTGCGVGVAAGGENASTNPALGIQVSPTYGAAGPPVPGYGPTGVPGPQLAYQAPISGNSPSGAAADSVNSIEQAVQGGCWRDLHSGDQWGALDQIVWYQGSCSSQVPRVVIESYASEADASSNAKHGTAQPVAHRYQDGSLLVSVYDIAPQSVDSDLQFVASLQPIQGPFALEYNPNISWHENL